MESLVPGATSFEFGPPFSSVQGYGKKPVQGGGFVYPGSGATCDTKAPKGEEAPRQTPQEEATTSEIGGHSLHSDLDPEVPPDDPDLEFAAVPGEHPPVNGPRIINVGIPGPGASTRWDDFGRRCRDVQGKVSQAAGTVLLAL